MKQFDSNDVMTLHRDMTAVKTLNETSQIADTACPPKVSYFSQKKGYPTNTI